MNKTINLNRQLLIFGTLILLFSAIIFVTKSSTFNLNPNLLSLGVTLDLLITIPFVYYLFIRKTTISKTTIVPFLILGIVLGTFILPSENQYYLYLFKVWVFPIIELSIISFVVYNIRKTIKTYKKRKELIFDFFTTLKETCYEILPKKVVIPVVTEIAVFYYGFIYWKKRILKENEFTYHKDSGTIALLIAIIFIIGIETYAFHVLLMKWSSMSAWVLTILSSYSAIQIFGFLKSIIKRPISIENNKLKIRYGILSEVFIKLEEIETIELTSKDMVFDDETRKLSPFGSLETHNVVIRLNTENTLIGLYGIKRKFRTLALYVDNEVEFKTKVDMSIKTTNKV